MDVGLTAKTVAKFIVCPEHVLVLDEREKEVWAPSKQQKSFCALQHLVYRTDSGGFSFNGNVCIEPANAQRKPISNGCVPPACSAWASLCEGVAPHDRLVHHPGQVQESLRYPGPRPSQHRSGWHHASDIVVTQYGPGDDG